MTETKTCPRCQTEKPLTQFHVKRDSRDGRQPVCAPCNAAAVAESTQRRRRLVDSTSQLIDAAGRAGRLLDGIRVGQTPDAVVLLSTLDDLADALDGARAAVREVRR